MSYSTPDGVDRAHLPGCDDVPRTHTSRLDDKVSEYLQWPAAEGRHGGSASPVHDRAFSAFPDTRKVPIAALLRNVTEGLELPGLPADYHFLIQHCVDELWRRRRDEPDLITEIERLGRLDIALVRARPDAMRVITNGEARFYSINAFSKLIRLYEGRGDLAGALEVAEIASRFSQCEYDRQRLQWQTGAREDEPVEPPELPAPQHPNGARPNRHYGNGRISDWGYRSGEPDGPFAGSRSEWYSWWSDWCQRRFDGLWTDEAGRVADNLADTYAFHWPYLISGALMTAVPATYERILDFAQDKQRPGPVHIPENPLAIYWDIASWGAFQLVRKRRTWREPAAAACPTCGQDFWTGDVQLWAIMAFGPARYCMDCCYQARNGDPRATWFEHEVKAALRELREALAVIPNQAFADARFPHDGSPGEQDRRIRALLAMPPADTIKRVLRQPDWLGALRAADLVGETWRPSRGTWCHANDGHRCRSLLEKNIDDWFTANGIAHECEPKWPRHETLNPTGAKRADWLLPDGTYVECAGMLESQDYAQKIAQKRQLATSVGIPLVVVAPTDMHRLTDIFAAQLQCGLLG